MQFVDEEGLIYKPLDFEIFGTISAFGMFEISRLAVFENLLRRASYLHLHLQALTDTAVECATPAEDICGRVQPSEIYELSKVSISPRGTRLCGKSWPIILRIFAVSGG